MAALLFYWFFDASHLHNFGKHPFPQGAKKKTTKFLYFAPTQNPPAMKILHFSDTHLGYHDLDKLSSGGVNLREQDIYDAFRRVIDIAIARRPDVVIHSGDFFHRPSPANRPMIVALQELERLSDAGIPIVIIAGNHETPRTIYTSPILQALRSIKGVHPIFQQKYEQVSFGDLVVHGLPHINDGKLLLGEMDKIAPVAEKFNIIMLHTSIGKEYLMEEYGELLYPKERMSTLDRFDYVALGHWHNFQQVPKLRNAWYAGSTERMSDTEAGKDKGYCWLELKKGELCPPQFNAITTRTWHRVEVKDCYKKDIQEIEQELFAFAKCHTIAESLISVYLYSIHTTQSVQLPHRRFQDIFENATHVQVKRIFKSDDLHSLQITTPTESLERQMADFAKQEYKDPAFAKIINEKLHKYFDLFENS